MAQSEIMHMAVSLPVLKRVDGVSTPYTQRFASSLRRTPLQVVEDHSSQAFPDVPNNRATQKYLVDIKRDFTAEGITNKGFDKWKRDHELLDGVLSRRGERQLKLHFVSEDPAKMDHVDEHGIITWENVHQSDIGGRNLAYYVDLQKEFELQQMTEEKFITFDGDWLANHPNDQW